MALETGIECLGLQEGISIDTKRGARSFGRRVLGKAVRQGCTARLYGKADPAAP